MSRNGVIGTVIQINQVNHAMCCFKDTFFPMAVNHDFSPTRHDIRLLEFLDKFSFIVISLLCREILYLGRYDIVESVWKKLYTPRIYVHCSSNYSMRVVHSPACISHRVHFLLSLITVGRVSAPGEDFTTLLDTLFNRRYFTRISNPINGKIDRSRD